MKMEMKKSIVFVLLCAATALQGVAQNRTVSYVKPVSFYFGGGYAVRSLGGVTALAGTVIQQRHDVQAHYTLGLTSTSPVHAYSNDGNDNYLSTMSFKQNTFGLKYGYQLRLASLLTVTPQVGFTVDQLSGMVEGGNGLYADGASSNNVSVGIKVLLTPFQHCHIFAAPEYNVGVITDDNYQRLTELTNATAGGFTANVGITINF